METEHFSGVLQVYRNREMIQEWNTLYLSWWCFTENIVCEMNFSWVTPLSRTSFIPVATLQCIESSTLLDIFRGALDCYLIVFLLSLVRSVCEKGTIKIPFVLNVFLCSLPSYCLLQLSGFKEGVCPHRKGH